MTQSVDRHDRAADGRTPVATKVRGGIRAVLSLIACAAMLLAGETFVADSPVMAQSAKQKAAAMKDLQAKRAEGGACKVAEAGFLLTPDNVHVVLHCPGKEPIAASSPNNRPGAGQETLSVALAAISTGKLVRFALANPADPFPEILFLILVNP